MHDVSRKTVPGNDFKEHECKQILAVGMKLAVFDLTSVSQLHLVASATSFLFHFTSFTGVYGRPFCAPIGQHFEHIVEFVVEGKRIQAG